MDKKEYMNIRLKKDFLQYSLLQEDSLSAKELCDKLYATIDFQDFLCNSKLEIERMINQDLSFDKVKDGDKLSNNLSDELRLELKDELVEKFQKFIDQSNLVSYSSALVNSITRHVEQLAWSNGIIEIGNAIHLLIERLKMAAKNYGEFQVVCMDESELVNKFNKAKEKTLIERFQGNNIDDILEYRNALSEYIQIKCENILYASLIKVIRTICNNNVLVHIQDRFARLQEYALSLKATLPVDLEEHSDWDEEYNKLVPTDFYCRNVESITSEQAFHMVLLQLFARNENWMKEKGMLIDGEISIYTNVEEKSFSELLIKLDELL